MQELINEMKNIITTLNKWTEAYDEGKPEVTDKEWDILYFKLQCLERMTNTVFEDSPTVKIHYAVKSKLDKVEHNHKMLSLAKTKDWLEFINYFAALDPGKDVCLMPKMDGLTCSVRYVDGKLVSAETRGDGEIGEDILHNVKMLPSVPNEINYKEELIIDGEVICTYRDFDAFAKEYKNPRNFASGSIRLLDSKECSQRHLTFVSWNVIKGFEDDTSFSSRLEKIRGMGFICVPYIMSLDYDAKEYMADVAKSLSYPIDGLVARFDDIAYDRSLGETSHHPRGAYAFKFFDEEYETKLLNVEWTMGRTSQLTPVAVFQEIDTGDSIISRASLHNISIMRELLGAPYYLQPLTVFKSNMIIPQIKRAVKRTPAEFNANDVFYVPGICPICGKETQIITSDSGTEVLICTNPQCEGKLSNIIDHFAGKKGLDIKGMSIATINKLIDWGWLNSVEDIFKLKDHRSEWVKKSGFGVKSVDNILAAIEAGRHCNLEDYIAALGIPLIGGRYAKIIASKEKIWDNFIKDIDSDAKFYLWEGFGPEMNDAILNYDYTLAKRLVESGIIIFNEPEEEDVEEQSLAGVKIVITGKLSIFKNRNELKAAIESHGGQVVGSVSKNTDILINNDVNSTTSKNASAKKLGIPIMSEKDFKEKYF